MDELTETMEAALHKLAEKTNKYGFSKTTRTQLQQHLGIERYHVELRPMLEDLQEMGLIEMMSNGTFKVSEEVLEKFGGRARTPARDSRRELANPRTLLRSPAPRLASERTGLVKSSVRCAEEVLNNYTVQRGQEQEPETIVSERIQRASGPPDVTRHAKSLATWFRDRVEEVMLDHGQARARPVTVSALAKHLKDWEQSGVPLSDAKKMMETFLADTSWLRVRDVAPWIQFLRLKDKLHAGVERATLDTVGTEADLMAVLYGKDNRDD